MKKFNQGEFETLDLKEQAKFFHQASFKERGELLFRSHDPGALTRSLSQEELYLMTREMDRDERKEIIRYTTLPQMFFISDIECWKKDEISVDGFIEWLEVLKDADEQHLFAWMLNMDYEMIVGGFIKFVQVIKPDWEYASDEILGDRPYFTLDFQYYVSTDEENLQTVKRAIEVLFENHKGKYAALMEGLLSELQYELEEEAYQKRQSRLADRGFPDPETAMRIFKPISADELQQFKKTGVMQVPDCAEEQPPSYVTVREEGQIFLDHVLLLCAQESNKDKEGVQEELAWLTNKVIAADGIDFASEEKVYEGIQRARSLVNLGLEVLSTKNLEKAKSLILSYWIEAIFRTGINNAMQVREEASAIVKSYWHGKPLSFFDFLGAPYQAYFEALLQTVPMFYDEERGVAPTYMRDFETLEDIAKIKKIIFQVDAIHKVLHRIAPRIFAGMDANGSSFTLVSTLGTMFAFFVTGQKKKKLSLAPKDMALFLTKGFVVEKGKRTLSMSLWQAFLTQFGVELGLDSNGPDVIASVRNQLEDELAQLNPAKAVDRRYISCVILE